MPRLHQDESRRAPERPHMREQIQQAIDLRDAVVTCFISGDGGELGCDVDRLYDLIDAALRRAKAEVLELAARELCMYCNDPGNWAPMSNSGYHQCNTPGPNMTRCGATKIHALRRELDARAAQIEEGSK